ncbi:MAG: VCBS repeat-containing protein, partial [Verrucomicrobiales bacterium]|nr:VCBS repeat-containing protein [Verrucomicrobiales bacterium]
MGLKRVFFSVWLVGAGVALADFEALRYGGEGKVVDLAVGLWAWPLPMDYDGDGDLDLVVACPDKPSRGTYFFENPGGGGKLPVFKPGVKVGTATNNMRVSYVGGVPRVLVAGSEVTDAVGGKFEKKEQVYPKTSVHPSRVRANQWTYVDWEGDGDEDIIVGAGDWADYGWDAAYDAQGRWRNGPLRGFVYLLEKKGDGWAEAVKVRAGGADVEVYGWPTPNFADFDGDGDLDLLCGEFLDGFTYFENAGLRGAPVYLGGKRLGVKMDLQMIVPTALDWDADGDVDLVVGDEDGRVALVEHTGEVVGGVPVFAEPVYFQQEADTLNAGALATPYAVDWDGDGDEDLLCGNTAGYVFFYENLTGGATPEWGVAERLTAGGDVLRIQAGDSGSIQGPCEAKWGYTTLSAADWDGDGKVDLVLNSIWGQVLWYRRGADGLEAARPVEVAWTAGARKPAWNWWDPNGAALATQWRTTPEAVDWDGDGLVDLVMLDQEGYLAFWKKREDGKVDEPARIFVDEKGAALRLNVKSCGGSGRVKLKVADWDGDGRKDVLVNSENAALLRNLGERDGTVVLKRSGNLGEQN